MPDLKAEIIPVENDADGVSCDGGGGALGHPRVWYTFDESDIAECGYCDRIFVKNRARDSLKTAGKKAGAGSA